jgi:hypothetical protein
MMRPEITLLRDVAGWLEPGKNPNVLTFQSLRDQITQGKGLAHILSYSRATLLTHRFELLNKPLNTAILLRLLTLGDCTIQDKTGLVKRVETTLLVTLLFRFLRDAFSKHRVLRKVAAEVESLNTMQPPSRENLSLTRLPLYLRTDLTYGWQSGGSVGHIAGVINYLGRFTSPPIFVTTDPIPTVDRSI